MKRENGRCPHAARGTRHPARGAKRPRRNRRRPDWLRMIFSGLLLLFGAECVWAAFHSPRLAVQRITVTGSKTLDPERLAAMTGIRVGDNIFRTNLYRARLRIRSALGVREANVARLLPGTIAVTLVEREPRLILVQAGRRYEVDAEGVVFRELPPQKARRGDGATGRQGETADGSAHAQRRAGAFVAPSPYRPVAPSASGSERLPYLVLRPGMSGRLGETLPRPVVEAALHCVRLARAEGLLLWKISIDAHDDLWLNVKVAGSTATSALSLPIRVGRPQELGAKFADTRHVLQHAPQLAAVAQYLDVSCPRRPAYRVAAGEPGRAVALTP